jgi:hypothetical protein
MSAAPPENKRRERHAYMSGFGALARLPWERPIAAATGRIALLVRPGVRPAPDTRKGNEFFNFVESLTSARVYEIAPGLDRAAHHTTKGKVLMRADPLRFQLCLKFLYRDRSHCGLYI